MNPERVVEREPMYELCGDVNCGHKRGHHARTTLGDHLCFQNCVCKQFVPSGRYWSPAALPSPQEAPKCEVCGDDMMMHLGGRICQVVGCGCVLTPTSPNPALSPEPEQPTSPAREYLELDTSNEVLPELVIGDKYLREAMYRFGTTFLHSSETLMGAEIICREKQILRCKAYITILEAALPASPAEPDPEWEALVEASDKATNGEWFAHPYSSILGSLISYGDISKGQNIGAIMPQILSSEGKANAQLVVMAANYVRRQIAAGRKVK